MSGRPCAPSPQSSRPRPTGAGWLAGVGAPAALLALLAASGEARAAWPEDVSLSGMREHDGVEVLDRQVLADDYRQVVRELGAAISGSPLPPWSLGASGFEITALTHMAFIDVYRDELDVPTAWERVDENEDPGPFLIAPGIMVRKGLPFSIDIGVEGRWIAGSRQGTFGGFVKVALAEQDKPWPEIALHLDYQAYVGNDELELGTLVFGGTLGGLFHTGPADGLRTAKVTPYADISLLVVHAVPVLGVDEADSIGAVPFGGPSPDRVALPPQPPIALARFSGGLDIVAGSLVIRLSGGYTLNARAHAQVVLGFQY